MVSCVQDKKCLILSYIQDTIGMINNETLREVMLERFFGLKKINLNFI